MYQIILSGILLLFFNTILAQEITFENNKYVIVLDVQEYWTKNSLSEEAAHEMLSSINSLIDKTDPDKIIYVKSPVLVATLSLKGVHTDTILNQEFDKNLKVVNNNVFVKTTGDAFSTTDLIHFLEKNNSKEIIITGLLAEKCVTHTAEGGIKRNYNIYIIPEAIGAKSKKSKTKTVNKLKEMGVKIIDSSLVDAN